MAAISLRQVYKLSETRDVGFALTQSRKNPRDLSLFRSKTRNDSLLFPAFSSPLILYLEKSGGFSHDRSSQIQGSAGMKGRRSRDIVADSARRSRKSASRSRLAGSSAKARYIRAERLAGRAKFTCPPPESRDGEYFECERCPPAIDLAASRKAPGIRSGCFGARMSA